MKPIHSILSAITMAAFASSASAATVVSNLAQPNGGALVVTSGFSSGQAFTTPATGSGWSLASLTFTLRESGTADAGLTVGLYSDASGNPGSLLVSLTGADPDGNIFADLSYTPTVSFTLLPNTTYFAVLSTTSSSGSYEWRETTTLESGDPGWSIANVSRRSLEFTPFDGAPLRLAVNAIPEPSAALLSLVGLGSLLIRRR